MTAIANLPDLRPSLLLDFANSGRVDPRIQCTRASSATCWGPDGKLRTVAANVPRIDYDPAAGKCLGLLVEDTRTNFATYSESFASGWVRQTLNLDGVDAGGIYTHRLHASSFTGDPLSFCLSNKAVAAGALTISICINPELNARYVQLAVGSAIAAGRVNFDLTEGIITANDSGNIASIQKLAVGYRISATFTVTESSNAVVFALLVVPTALVGRWQAWMPTSQISLLIGRPQVEQGSFPSSYIPTEGSAVTRAQDVVTMGTAGWYNSSGSGAILCEFLTKGGAEGGPWWLSSPPTTLRGIGVYRQLGASSRLSGAYRLSDAHHASSLPQGSYTEGVKVKLGASFSESSGIFLCKDGGNVTDPGGSSGAPVVTTLRIGESRVVGGGPFAWTGLIERLVYYPSSLSAQQLQRLTA